MPRFTRVPGDQPDPEPTGPTQFQHLLEEEMRQRRMNTFRHTFAVRYLIAHPGSVVHLKELLGHSNLEMTLRYARLAETETRLPGPSPVDQLGLGRLLR